MIPVFVENSLAAAAFLVFPVPAMFSRTQARAALSGDAVRQVVSTQLVRMGGAFADIAKLTSAACEQLEKMRADASDSTMDDVAQKVCRSCRKSSDCWQARYGETAGVFAKALACVAAQQSVAPDSFPEHFECLKKQQLADVFNNQLEHCAAREKSREQAMRMRMVTPDQFESVAMMLDAMQKDTEKLSEAPFALSRSVAKLLAEHMPEAAGSCYLDASGRPHVLAEVHALRFTQNSVKAVTAGLSDIFGAPMDAPEIVRTKTHVRVLWMQQAKFTAAFDCAQACAQGKSLCGDSFRSVTDPDGRMVLLLADGMGVGTTAAVDAAMTTSLLSGMLNGGVRCPAALRMVDAALIAGKGEERLCTVDVGILDLFMGRIEFYKAGAAPSFLVRGDKVTPVQAASLPAGILGGTQAERTDMPVRDGDVVVMASDGLTDLGEDWICAQLGQLADRTPAEIVRGLVDAAMLQQSGGHADDITAVAALVSARAEQAA
jgi:stage II sporulation protein E